MSYTSRGFFGSFFTRSSSQVFQVSKSISHPEISLDGLEPASKFEFSLPFYRIDIETLVERLKQATY